MQDYSYLQTVRKYIAKSSGIICQPIFALLILIQIGAVYSVIYHPWLSVIIIIAPIIMFLLLKHYFYGLCSYIFLHILLTQASKEISAVEITYGLFSATLLLYWFYNKLIVRKDRLLTDAADYFLLIFIALCFFSFFTAYIHGVNLVKWFRELVFFIGYLYFYIFKDVLKNDRHIAVVLISFMLLITYLGIQNVKIYLSLMNDISYVFEILGSRQAGFEPFYYIAVVASTTFTFYSKPWKIRLLSLFIAALSGTVLILTFSRGYWVTALFALVLLFLLSDIKIKLSMLTVIPLSLILVTLFFHIFLGNLTDIFYKTVSDRFTSLEGFISDVSFMSRMSETKALFARCLENPIAGHGLGSTYMFYDITINYHKETWYSHNAYLFLLFKLGIVGLISYLLWYLTILWKGFKLSRNKSIGWFRKSIVNFSICGLAGLLPLSITSPQFFDKDSILVIMFCSSMIAVVEKINRFENGELFGR